ncbi:tripartite tricarboxylate transporter permease [Natrononativus amylolyticus]|uniref:tripartite tricarboxylate transporter permease n=1 Tax=Natrononativus amylolyticus TaxID=2963434 RepID=UPI0020CD931D|nr:tripartite tricarboxylate transporter permease [Natrononativus amylolyticus]
MISSVAVIGLISEALLEAIGLIARPETLMWIVVGICLGIVVGALPGLGPPLGMAILLPLTLPLSGTDAIIFLVSIYSGSMYGGSIAAILVNVPGTPASAATTFDGYPLSKSGRAMDALTMSASASAFAGLFTVVLLILLSPVLIGVVLSFGSPEYFLVAILGLSMITIVSQGSIVKGFAAGAFGLLLTTIGIAPMTPELRYTFGQTALYDGLSFIAVMLGLFAIAEMLNLAAKPGGITDTEFELSGNMFSGVRSTLSRPVLVFKSGFLGMAIGAIPGSGAAVSNFVAYAEAIRSSATPELFGEGNAEGVIAAEASNNGTVGGSLIPTLSFGIPGSGSTAVLLGGLLMHGLRPGPDLFSSQLAITYSIFLALLIGNLLILGLGVVFVVRLSYITRVDTNVIIPIIVVFSVVGGLAVRNNWADVATLLVLGVIGYYMYKHDYSIIALVLGVVLGPIAEENFHRSLALSDGSFLIFVTRPISILLVVLTLAVLLGPLVKAYRTSGSSA